MIVRDGEWTLFDADISLGRYVWRRTNDDGTVTFRTDYHVDQSLDANAAARNMAEPGWKNDWHRVASIPLNVFWDQLAGPSKQDDRKFISRWLNDSDHAKFRTKEGRV